MKCSEAAPLLDPLFDGALDAKDSALVLDHLKSCNSCQSEWDSLEQLRSAFQEIKAEPQLPHGLMDKISETLCDEERQGQAQLFAKSVRVVSFAAAVAAAVMLMGFLLFSWIHRSDTRQTVVKMASADTLVADLLSDASLDPVPDKKALPRKLGYDLKYLKLQQWQMVKCGLYKSPAPVAIARLDFVRKNGTGYERLSCYQARQGSIVATGAAVKNLDGKRVYFGKRGNLQFALWSQNGRDYLFVTPLSSPELEEIVRNA
jgi:anti-sigma factor RsiW